MSYNALNSKEHLEAIFLALAKEYRRLAKRRAIPIEITVIGGASIMMNYNFRESTYDVDAIMPNDFVIKEAIKNVGLKFNLEEKWLNTDFEKSSSYSRYLLEYSVFYKDYLGLIEVRTIKDQYLIAMKLKASREYKYDISDVVGILSECKKQGKLIDKLLIEKAVIDLYGSKNDIKQEVWERLDFILKNGDYDFLVKEYRKAEMAAKATQIEKMMKDKQQLKDDNTEELLSILSRKKPK